jgi:exosortase
VPLLALGLALRLFGTFWHFISLDAISIVPTVAGLTLLLGGRAGWRWAWPGVLFLAFMIPLPFSVAGAMSGPLQRLATVSSTFVMQTLGMPALAEGNVIRLNDHEIGIVEACSGLRMLVVFIALATAVTLVIRRHWIDRVLILASAVPIALLSNMIRVTVTGIMYEAGYSEMASHFFHDVAGWLMMPLALGMLGLELKVLSWLFVEAPAAPARQAAPRPTRARPAPRTRRPAARPAEKRQVENVPHEQPVTASPSSAQGQG